MKEKQALFDRTYQLEQEILTLQEDIKELKSEFTYEKEYNIDGFPKADVADIMKAAKAKAKNDNLEEKIEDLKSIQNVISQYS